MDMMLVRLHIRHAYALLHTGQWDAADAEIGAIQQTPLLAGIEAEQSAHVEALLDLRRGRERADNYWRRMIAGETALALDPWYAPQAVARCEAAWLRGDEGAVRRIAAEALPAALASGEGWRIGQLACWGVRAGGARPAIALPLPAACRCELAGDARGAARAWAQAGCGYEQALALLAGGEAEWRAALALLDTLGAEPAARIARRRLHAAGVRDLQRGPYAHARSDPLGLTARERQVLELLADRLTNRQIAQRLQRSERTVENHVAALLLKLGVATRADAAALVRDDRGAGK